MAGRIAVLSDGWVVEMDAYHELLDRRGTYASLYRSYERLSPERAGRVVGATDT
jgi:ABC-type multidrug transport system fused ATPase/permease subunit